LRAYNDEDLRERDSLIRLSYRTEERKREILLERLSRTKKRKLIRAFVIRYFSVFVSSSICSSFYVRFFFILRSQIVSIRSIHDLESLTLSIVQSRREFTHEYDDRVDQFNQFFCKVIHRFQLFFRID
jgi:Mg2+/Co2+ transporter CorC